MALDHPQLHGRRLYRSLLIIPYAIPSFVSALVWAGLLNQDFGIINRMLGTDLDWLGDPWLARFSVVLVNTWLGFPYMMLVSMGALQAIPGPCSKRPASMAPPPGRAFDASGCRC